VENAVFSLSDWWTSTCQKPELKSIELYHSAFDRASKIKYKDVFSKLPDDLGRTDRIKHHINTGNATPIRVPSRRLPIGKREIEKQEVHKMLEKGIIEVLPKSSGNFENTSLYLINSLSSSPFSSTFRFLLLRLHRSWK
jgi:hypothetical protein